ncbi:hypothetical protein BAE44_0002699 [Dichanthelium oligosanthes]|uniref:Uncharacterized protein n=1 Tax=Dichanthelium oligosanthes TaxID=888268 RepID=A0A1E5WFW0_9POAL|nr:hypothetical protein BAE44_0002699 [Dichanthelium oligosanthes]
MIACAGSVPMSATLNPDRPTCRQLLPQVTVQSFTSM